MFRIILTILLALPGGFVFGQYKIVLGPQITFINDVASFDTVEYSESAKVEYLFVNTGFEPLKIFKIKSVTGSMVPNWPTDPIAPGDTGVITLRYACCRPGHWKKSPVVFTNAVNAPQVRITIIGYRRQKESLNINNK